MSPDLAHILHSRRCSDSVCFLRDFCRADDASARLTVYEHPACQAPHTPFSFLSSCPPFLLFDRAAGFLAPRPRIVAGRRAQGVSRLAAFQRPPSGLGLYTTEHDGRLDGSGRLHSYLIFSSSTCRRGCYCIPITDVIFWQVLLRGPWRVR